MIRFLTPGPSFITPIDPTNPDTKGWTTHAVGIMQTEGRTPQVVHLSRVLHFVAAQEGIGKLEFGVRNWQEEGGRHGWVFTDRGGVVVIALAQIDGRDHIGLLTNIRMLARHGRAPIPELVRGFFVGDTDDGALALREEVREEAGFDPKAWQLANATQLLGIDGGVNWNNTFNNTGLGNGVEYWVGRVPTDVLEPQGDGTYTFRKAVLESQVGTPSGAPGERVMKTVFYPADRLPATPDLFTLGGYGIYVLLQQRGLLD